MDVDELAKRHEQVTAEQESAILTKLLKEGWDAGCWIRPDPELVMQATDEEVIELLKRLGKRQRGSRPALVDPYPEGRPQEPIDGQDSCFIVVSQRCDIANDLKTEPLVELAPATFCKDKGRIKTAAKNSPREFPVDPSATETFMVDLRYRFFIPEIDLVELPAKQALPKDEPGQRVRQRFLLRLGQRYTRAAVPDDLFAKVVVPLREIVLNDTEANHIFDEWALFHGGEPKKRPGLQAVYPVTVDPTLDDAEQARQEDAIRQKAEDKFQEILEALPKEAKAMLDLGNDERTHAVSETELVVAKWRLSWKLEWDAPSFSGDPDAALPAR